MKRDTREQASRIGIAPKTLDNWRSDARRTGKPLGPPYYKVGGKIIYDDSETDAWLAGVRVTPGQKPSGAA